MKEINIAKTIIQKRKEKGITQDDLAKYIGVSNASVSKWETGQSYPDITFLPQLATYFNISIDDLMGYEPQMSKADIRKLYLELSSDFVEKSFDEVMDYCRETSKKYFSCFPLLFQIGALIVNNSSLAKEFEKCAAAITEAKELFIRIKEHSEDVELIEQAIGMEAVCAHILGNPVEVLELLEGMNTPKVSPEPLLAAAYQMTGKTKEAKSVLQIGIYRYISVLFGLFPPYLSLYSDNPERFEEIHQRIVGIADLFKIKELHPSILLNVYLSAAQGYLAGDNTDNAVEMLERYTEIVTGDIYPLQLKGDDFFDLLDDWFEEFPLGTAMPRDEVSVRQSMTDAIVRNPVFFALAENPRYQRLAEKLKNNC